MQGRREEPRRSSSRRSKGCYDTKLQLYLHAYDEGERNIQELKRLLLNSRRNIEMLKICWNELSKRTVDRGGDKGNHRISINFTKELESTP